MLTYSFRSVKKVKPQKEEVTETPKTSSTEKKEVESGQDLATKEGDEKAPPDVEPAGAEPDESVAESEALPPPDALDPAEDMAPPDVEPAGAEPDKSVAESEALPPPDALGPAEDMASPEAGLAGAEPDESVAESEALPPPDALDPADEPPPLPSVDAASNDGEAQSQDGGLANNEFVENHGSESPPLNPTDPEAPSS